MVTLGSRVRWGWLEGPTQSPISEIWGRIGRSRPSGKNVCALLASRNPSEVGKTDPAIIRADFL